MSFFMWRRGSVVIAKIDFMFIYVNRSIFLLESLQICIWTSRDVPQVFILFIPVRLNGVNSISFGQ